MGLLQSQATIPIFANTTDLGAYVQDGILAGMIASTVSPRAFWQYSATLPVGATGIAAAAALGGYWLQYSGALVGGSVWLAASGAFTTTQGSGYSYTVDVSTNVASTTFPANAVDGEEHRYKVGAGADAHAFTLTRGSGQTIESPVDGSFNNTAVMNIPGQELGWYYELANTRWRLF